MNPKNSFNITTFSKKVDNFRSEKSLAQIEQTFNQTVLIQFLVMYCSMIGLCSKYYTSGVSLVLHEETFEAVCDKCRN